MCIVEGKAEDEIVRILGRKIWSATGLRIGFDVFDMRGHGGVTDVRRGREKLRSVVSERDGTLAVIAIRDNDCLDDREQRAKVTESKLADEGLRFPPVYFVAMQTLEGWLISDPTAVQSWSGRVVRAIAHPQTECHPDKWLGTLAPSGRGYNKITDGMKLAERLNIDIAAQRNASLAAFRDHILSLVPETNS
ncbi:MAG: DUF4276 family protein [Chloroflexi bacterium]|nr:DUF4276 family protein [Chloroflexota bacterium]